MQLKTLVLALVAAGVLSPGPARANGTELLELRNTIVNLVDELVRQGVLTAEGAERMKREAATKAREETARQVLAEGGATEARPPGPGTTAVVRVPYVPEFVKDEIRAQVREELRAEVTSDVVAVAKAEQWGTARALPDWVSGLELSGDVRLRAQGIYQDAGNDPGIPDFQAINEAGGAAAAGSDVFLNTTEDVRRGQVRLRLGLSAALGEDFSVVTRLATGNDMDPTTRNQRFGTYNRPFDLFVDLVYAEWRLAQAREGGGLQARAGRLPNPFRTTSLVFDDDLTFDGLSLQYRADEVLGSRHSVFASLGGFTLLAEEANLLDGGTDAKYWWGGQLGAELALTEHLGLVAAGAYYDFVNVEGVPNDFNSTSQDWTAPAFIVKGNTVFDIRNDLDPDTQLFALAPEFTLVNAMVELDYRRFSPVHVVLRGDYVTNIGYDAAVVEALVGVPVGERNDGWSAQLEVGHPRVTEAGQWQVFAGYRHLQRDAVLDAYTDSDFHGGGTDAEGWIAGGLVGLGPDLSLRLRWLSADEIDGAPAGFGAPFRPYALDVLQVDLNARF